MASPRRFALISGVVYVALGILSLIPALSTMPPEYPRLHLETSYGAFFGLFAQNIVNKLAILAFGAAGLAAYRSKSDKTPVLYARAVTIVMGAAAILGVIPATDTFFGYWPLFGNEAMFHAVNAFIAAYFGFVAVAHDEEYRFSRPSLSH